MTTLSRRTFVLSGGALVLAACNNGVGSGGEQQIEARVEATLQYLYGKYPGTRDLANKAAGMLVMPLVTKAGIGFGGSYGQGALRIGGVSVDYYSATAASFGLQIGAQQYAHVLFFMTQDALSDFRRSYGWAAGADVEFVLKENGENLSAETTTSMAPIIALIFGQAGLHAGASVKGVKYTRIIPSGSFR